MALRTLLTYVIDFTIFAFTISFVRRLFTDYYDLKTYLLNKTRKGQQ